MARAFYTCSFKFLFQHSPICLNTQKGGEVVLNQTLIKSKHDKVKWVLKIEILEILLALNIVYSKDNKIAWKHS